MMMTLLDKVSSLSTQQARETLPPLVNDDPNLKMSQSLPQMKDVNYVGEYNGQGGGWYGQGKQFQQQGPSQPQVQYITQGGGSSYNPNVRKHENFSYSNPKAVQFPSGFDPGAKLPTHEGKLTNEDALTLILKKMGGIEENGKSMTKNYKSLEAQFTQMSHQFTQMSQQQRTTDFQLGQLAQMVGNMQNKGKFPSTTEPNPKEHCKAIELRSGTKYQGPPLPSEDNVEEKCTEMEQGKEKDKVDEMDEDEEIDPCQEDEEEKGLMKNDKEDMKKKPEVFRASAIVNCCYSHAVSPPPLMAAPPIHRRCCTSPSSAFPFRYNPHPLNPSFFVSPKPPLDPSKTSISISFSFLTISPRNNRRNLIHFPSASQNPDSEQGAYDNRFEEAREAIREYLEQVGASREDAYGISLNCPNYLKMLIDGVDDLDDWNSWASAAATPAQNVAGDAVEFKKKIQQMAEQKGDNGILPFLESVGLSLSSATHLARYLSSSDSNALPLLIEKVKYMKEILFSDSNDHELIGKNARRMMSHLSISADEDVQQTLACFEKIEARRGGLNHLGSENTSFRCLIESFPRLLSLPLQSRVKPIVAFLGDIGVPRRSVRNVLLLFPPILSYDIEKDIKPRLKSFGKIGAKDDDLGKILVKYPWILSASILENFKKVLDFFDEEKVPRVCSSRAIKNWPHILGCSVNKLKLMVEEFSEMGIENKKLGRIIAKSPQLLLRKPLDFLQVVSFFKNLGLDEEAIARTLGRCPEIFAMSIDTTLEKKLKFLSYIGVSRTHIPRVIRKYPELFVCDVDRALLPR
ncbi:hypothetical protein ACS0TY_022190 [Phlomoides rotata]